MAQEIWYKDANGVMQKMAIPKSALASAVQTSLGKADTALQSHQDISGKANTSDLGTAAYKNTGTSSGNVPVLDSNGKLNSSVLPAIAITDTFVTNSQASMLALAAEVGDVCVRTDLNKSFILKESGASTLSHWQELLTPTDAVTSVNGQTGAVTITAASLGALTSHQDISGKLDKSGGTMTGSIKYNSNSLPSKNLEYIMGIDAFASGGESGWQSKSDFLSGYATQTWVNNKGYLTSHQSLDSCAKIGQANNLIMAGNEFNFIPDNQSGAVYFNYETVSRNHSGNITEYILGNGKAGSLGTIIHSGNIGSQSVNYASSAGAVAWSNVSGKPSSFTPSSHNHNDLYVRYDTASQGLNDTQKSNARTNIGAGTSNFSGSYNDLTNKPTIPTNTNQLTNGAGYITSSGSCQHAGTATNATHAGDADYVNYLYIHHINYEAAFGNPEAFRFTMTLISSDNTPMTSLDDIIDYMRNHTIGANPLQWLYASVDYWDDDDAYWRAYPYNQIFLINDELCLKYNLRLQTDPNADMEWVSDGIVAFATGYYDFSDEVATYNP